MESEGTRQNNGSADICLTTSQAALSAMIQETTIPVASKPRPSAWFYIAWSFGALASSFFILPGFVYEDTGPTFSHFGSVGVAQLFPLGGSEHL